MAKCCSECNYMDVDDDADAFREVLKAMMYSFGDVKEPLKESADIVYEILRNDMNFMLTEVERIAHFRKTKTIGHEDMLFLMRKNKGKLKRLIRYLEVMDDMPGFGKKAALSFSSALENGCQTRKEKRVEKCMNFLASIEDCGEYTSIMNDDTIIDVAHKKMLERRNSMTKWMNLNEYKEYTEKILQNSFWAKPALNNFEKWLLEDDVIKMHLTVLACEIIRFLARETVSKIVDLALTLKSRKNRRAKSPEVFLKPFDFHQVAKECNFAELFPPLSTKEKTARNADHSYHANNDSKESSIVHIRRSTSIPGTSKNFVESKAPTKDTVSLITGEKNDGVDKLHTSSNVPVSKNLVTPKVLTLTTVPSVIRVKNVDLSDNLHHPTSVPETPEDIAGPSKPDLESISGVADKDNSDSDSITQQCTVSTDDTNEDQQMDESDSENQYCFVEDDSDSQSKHGDRNSDESTQLSNTDIPTSFLKNYVSKNRNLPRERISNLMIDSISEDEIRERDSSNTMHFSSDTTSSTSVQPRMTPDVTPSYSRYSSNDKSEDIIRKYQELSENGPHPQTPITPDEIIEAVAIYQQNSWTNFFQSSEKPPKTKLLCLDQHAPLLNI